MFLNNYRIIQVYNLKVSDWSRYAVGRYRYIETKKIRQPLSTTTIIHYLLLLLGIILL